MKRILRISKIKKIENDLRQQEKEKVKTKKNSDLDFDSMLKEEKRKLEDTENKRKKPNALDAYKFEIQRSIIAQKRISSIYKEEKEQEEK